MLKRIILTVGPSLLHGVKLAEIHNARNIYRINGAHGTIADIEGYIDEIRTQLSNADILIDLPGNKIRTSFTEPLTFESNTPFSIPSGNFNYKNFHRHLKPGMLAWANDSIFEFTVLNADQEKITFTSKTAGTLTNGKGVHVRGIHDDIPFLFPKDEELLDLCNRKKIAFAGLSFVRKATDVEEAKSRLLKGTDVFTKIETKDAVQNLDEIFEKTSYIIVDRGDLSTEVGITKIPRYQKFIVTRAHYMDKKVFLATQILKNMEIHPTPTIAEVDDLYNILRMGIYGVQMSEETAVGKHVKACVDFICQMDMEITCECVD